MRATIPTAATDYPTKVVRMIEPFGPGSGPEVIATAVSRKLAELWGQPVTVENHPGAGSKAAPAMVAKSPADGYTLLVHTNAHAYSAALVTNLPYDPLTDFVPVAALTTQSYVLVTGETTALATVSALIAAAKAKPGELRFGSTGVGTGTHLGVEKFNLAAGIDATHVPARVSDAIADTILNTIAGRTDYALSPIPTTLPMRRRAGAGGEHHRPVRRDHDRVLFVGTQGPVQGANGPTVAIESKTSRARGEHRLDREHQSWGEALTGLRGWPVEHGRRLVHRAADPVPGELSKDPEAAGLGDPLNGSADVAQPGAGLSCPHSRG
jgi:hypothetical protein